MALGTDMKSLVDDILASREDRAKAVSDIRKDAHHALAGAKSMLKDFAKKGEERAQDVKRMAGEVESFLKSSGENRKHDFEVTMKTVHTSLEDVRKDSKSACHAGRTIIKDAKALLVHIAKDNEEGAKELRDALKKGETQRMADFKTTMGAVQEDLKDVKHDVLKVKKDARDMVSRYHYSRTSAQKHWASLSADRKKKEHKSEEKPKE